MYYKSNMILYTHSDASYLSEPKPDPEREGTSTLATAMNQLITQNSMAVYM
jgi:hypothetical protein